MFIYAYNVFLSKPSLSLPLIYHPVSLTAFSTSVICSVFVFEYLLSSCTADLTCHARLKKFVLRIYFFQDEHAQKFLNYICLEYSFQLFFWLLIQITL